MGQLALNSSAIVYVDTAILIYTVEANPAYFTALQPLWQQFQAGDIELITSELTLMETLVTPLRKSDSILVSDYEQLLTASEIKLLPINQSILKTAAYLRATTNLKTPDAIHASTAINNSCTIFLTNDRGFQNNALNLPVLILSEVIQA
jgi:predicted nucleic acid-binding protein